MRGIIFTEEIDIHMGNPRPSPKLPPDVPWGKIIIGAIATLAFVVVALVKFFL